MLGVIPEETYPTESFVMQKKESWVLYTDGVVDALAPTGDRFGGERLRDAIRKSDSAQGLLRQVQLRVEAFREGRELADDLTLVVIRRIPVAAESMAAVVRGS